MTNRFVVILTVVCAAMLVVAFTGPAFAVDPINTTFFGDLAVEGYDPVAYFTEGEPVKGEKKFSLEHEGATWRFSSAENRAIFRENPDAYAPQYGGYCAWAVAQGYTAEIDPEAWAIRDGKLYLNYDDEVQAKWLEDPEGFIEKADAQWPELLAE